MSQGQGRGKGKEEPSLALHSFAQSGKQGLCRRRRRPRQGARVRKRRSKKAAACLTDRVFLEVAVEEEVEDGKVSPSSLKIWGKWVELRSWRIPFSARRPRPERTKHGGILLLVLLHLGGGRGGVLPGKPNAEKNHTTYFRL